MPLGRAAEYPRAATGARVVSEGRQRDPTTRPPPTTKTHVPRYSRTWVLDLDLASTTVH